MQARKEAGKGDWLPCRTCMSDKKEPLLKNVYVGLKSTYETPHICGCCSEHIGYDWGFCPECGTPTGLTEADVKEYYQKKAELEEKVLPSNGGSRAVISPQFIVGDTVYDRRGNPWEVTVAELHKRQNGELGWLYRCGHTGTQDYCALYEDEVVTPEDAAIRREAWDAFEERINRGETPEPPKFD